MRFRDEDAIRREQAKHAFDNVVNILDVCEDVGGGQKFGLAVSLQNLLDRGAPEERIDRWDAALDANFESVGWLDAADAMSLLEVAEESPVVRAHIHDKVGFG